MTVLYIVHVVIIIIYWYVDIERIEDNISLQHFTLTWYCLWCGSFWHILMSHTHSWKRRILFWLQAFIFFTLSSSCHSKSTSVLLFLFSFCLYYMRTGNKIIEQKKIEKRQWQQDCITKIGKHPDVIMIMFLFYSWNSRWKKIILWSSSLHGQ